MALLQVDIGHVPAYFEPKLRLLGSHFSQRYIGFKKKLKSYTFFGKLSTLVFDVLRLNHGHGRHESVTRLGVFGGVKSNGSGQHLWRLPALPKTGIFWVKIWRVRGLYGTFLISKWSFIRWLRIARTAVTDTLTSALIKLLNITIAIVHFLQCLKQRR